MGLKLNRLPFNCGDHFAKTPYRLLMDVLQGPLPGAVAVLKGGCSGLRGKLSVYSPLRPWPLLPQSVGELKGHGQCDIIKHLSNMYL